MRQWARFLKFDVNNGFMKVVSNSHMFYGSYQHASTFTCCIDRCIMFALTGAQQSWESHMETCIRVCQWEGYAAIQGCTNEWASVDQPNAESSIARHSVGNSFKFTDFPYFDFGSAQINMSLIMGDVLSSCVQVRFSRAWEIILSENQLSTPGRFLFVFFGSKIANNINTV